MKLNYKIIWIDDKIETRPFQDLKRQLYGYLQEQFFEASIEEAEDFNGFREKFSPNTEYDLIITDLTLNDSDGKQVIDYVREVKHDFTEIFFYSANKTLKQTNLLNNNRITFFQLSEPSAYRELGDEIANLISLTISKFQHIVSMRGMIMNETSSLDQQKLEILKRYIGDNDCDFLVNVIFDKLSSQLKEKTKKAEKRKLKELIEDNWLFSAEYKIVALGEILKHLGEPDFSGDYKKEIINIRNKFAHAVLVKDEKGKDVFKDSELTFDDILCKKIRKDIIKHKQNLDNLNDKI